MVKEKFENLTDYLSKVSAWKIILMSFFLCMFITFLQQIAFHLWGTLKADVLRQMLTDSDSAENVYLARVFTFGVILIPLAETLFFQAGIMNIFFILDYKFEYEIALPIIVSALIFGAAHGLVPDNLTDSIIRVIGASLIGLVLAYNYAIFHLRNRKATLYTLIVHGLINMYSSVPAILFIRLYDFLYL